MDDPNFYPEVNLNYTSDNAEESAQADIETAPHYFSRVAESLGTLTLAEDSVLAPHQVEAFDDIVRTFRSGIRETYAKLPTSTGKTVLFVEICKRLIDSTPEGEEKPRIIVLTSNIDLADQIVGSVEEGTGKRRGFKGFAPELDVRPLHSKISSRLRNENVQDAQVLATTYDSFRNLVSSFIEAESKTPEEWDNERDQTEILLQKSKLELSSNIAERRNFIQLTFARNRVEDTQRTAARLLYENENNQELSRKEINNIQSILNVSEINEPAPVVMRKIRRVMASQLNPDMKSALLEMEHVRILREKREKNSENDESSEYETPFKTYQEIIDSHNLNEYEKFVVGYVNRTRNNRTPTSSDISNSDDRDVIYEYNYKIQRLRSNISGYNGRIKAIAHLRVVQAGVSQFALIVCDEAHRSIGTETWESIREYAQLKDIAIIGFTATDEYYDRNLEDYFETKAHDLSIQAAMLKEIVNPVSIFVHDTGLRFRDIGLDSSGDYDRLTIRALRSSEERNQIGMEYAKTLSEHGYSGIMSGIPGMEGEHAKLLAKMLNEQLITDPKTGELRYLRAKYILGGTPTELRKEYYRAFENGELDWLTFIDAIREGWDSDRAKALINLRPTRSPLLATQRLGRIGRISDNAPISVVVDLYDGLEGQEEGSEIPPVLAADVFDINDIEQGYIVGNANVESFGPSVLELLKSRLPGRIKAHYNQYIDVLDTLPVVDRRGIATFDKQLVSAQEWQTLEALQTGSQGFLPKELITQAASGDTPNVRSIQARQGYRIIPLFNIHDVQGLYQDRPEINPWKLHVDENSQQWITPEGITKLLSKRFPNIEVDEIKQHILEIDQSAEKSFEQSVGRVRLNYTQNSPIRIGLTQMYKLDEIVERLVPYLIEVSKQ